MGDPYYYVRFRWSKGIDFDEVAQEFGLIFSVEQISRPYDEKEISVYKKERERLKVRADTLGALLAPYRAVLYQRDAAPLTAKDMKLRKSILELYPRKTSSFFSWQFSVEPEFEVTDDKQ